MYELVPGRISIVTRPPEAEEITPAWTPAVQMRESSVYTPVPQIAVEGEPEGHRNVSLSPFRPRYVTALLDQVVEIADEASGGVAGGVEGAGVPPPMTV